MPTAPSRVSSLLVDVPTIYPTAREWQTPYVYIQSLVDKYGCDYGSVKVVPPLDWAPILSPWRSDNVRFKPKAQVLGMLDGENRQEQAFQKRARAANFRSGVWLNDEGPMLEFDCGRKLRLKIRKLSILLSEPSLSAQAGLHALLGMCTVEPPPHSYKLSDNVMRQLEGLMNQWCLAPANPTPNPVWSRLMELSRVPSSHPPRDRSGTFLTYLVPEDKYFITRVTSGVKRPASRALLPFVTTEMTEVESGECRKSQLDDEDVTMYIANGGSKEFAFLATRCFLCEVCSIVTPYLVPSAEIGLSGLTASADLSEDATTVEGMLNKVRLEHPSLMCSGCSRVVHADCVALADERISSNNRPHSSTDQCSEEFILRSLLRQIAQTGKDWFCPDCVFHERRDEENLKFGLNLHSEMKRKEFERIGTQVAREFGITAKTPVESIESKFWHLLQSNSDLTVLYASDLDSGLVADGEFPDSFSDNHPTRWDLRHLALSPDSVLKHLPRAASINGVSRPWMYLGSPLSSFCWHVEDQLLCSVSYLHEGAAKVWYTIPAAARRKVDAAFHTLFPDLFEVNHDLHHQLVTMVNPEMMATVTGVQVGRAVQNAGEFIITFPEAYHAGFNCGNNLAEAVNVAIPAWLPHGMHAVDSHRQMKRQPVFCFDHLVWCMTTALVEGMETRRSVAEFCVERLIDAANEIEGVAKNVGTTSTGTVAAVGCSNIPVCVSCKNFCYFVCVVPSSPRSSNYCSPACAMEGGCDLRTAKLITRHEQDILKFAYIIKSRIMQYTDVRRSARVTPKRPRGE